MSGGPLQTGSYTRRSGAWEWQQSWHFLLFLTVYLYWVPLFYMGLRTLHLRWIVYGGFYAMPGLIYGLARWTGGGWVEPTEAYQHFEHYLFRSMLAFAVFAFIHSCVARAEFLMRLADDAEEFDELAQRAAERRGEAGPADRTVEPAPRRLLDLNTVTQDELAMLPGMNAGRAREALRLRAMQGGFESFRQFADQLGIEAGARERLGRYFDDDPDASPPPTDPSFRVLADGRRVLELNWASLEALAALPGLGPESARRALQLRDSGGPFKSLEDFRYRLGLKLDTMIRIEPYISVVSMSTVPGGGTEVKTGGRIVDV